MTDTPWPSLRIAAVFAGNSALAIPTTAFRVACLWPMPTNTTVTKVWNVVSVHSWLKAGMFLQQLLPEQRPMNTVAKGHANQKVYSSGASGTLNAPRSRQTTDSTAPNFSR